MTSRFFGSTKIQVAVVGQGTWNMEVDSKPQTIAAIRRGIDLGLTHIDTAEMYGAGRVEEMLAEALAGRRDEVFLVSKVLPGNATFDGTIEACEKSLARLKTDRLDAYLLHWPGENPLEDTIRAFERLQKQGKIRAWGVSNFDEKELAQALKIAGAKKIACNQVLYHLEERAIEHAVVPWCEKHGVAVVAYSPFGSGRFPSPKSKGGAVLEKIADDHHATPRQVALAFLTRHTGSFAIPKASDPAHVEENAGVDTLRLSGTDLAAIDAAFPLGRRRPGVPTL